MEIIKLPNGIDFVYHPMVGYRSVATGIWVRTGSRYEAEKESGASHFLEHLLFKGTGKRSCEELKRLVEGVGGTFNAFTGEEATCYYIKMPSRRYLSLALDILSDMATNPSLPSVEVERERNVILEEIKMYQDVPAAYVHELFQALLFPDHPLGRFIAGSPETVSHLNRERLFSYWRRHYTAGSLVVSIAGGFTPEEAKEAVFKFLGNQPAERSSSFLPATEKKPGPDFSFYAKETEQVHFCLGGRGYADEDKRRAPLSLLSVILGGNMSSRLFTEVREKRGLVYQISAGASFFTDTGLFLVEAGTSPKTLKEALKVILGELTRIKEELVPEEEISRAKEFIFGQMDMRLENTSEYMNYFGSQLTTKHRVQTPEETKADINAVNAPQIQAVARELFTKSNLNLALIGPSSSQEGLEEIVTLY